MLLQLPLLLPLCLLKLKELLERERLLLLLLLLEKKTRACLSFLLFSLWPPTISLKWKLPCKFIFLLGLCVNLFVK